MPQTAATSPESRYKRLAVPLGFALVWAAVVGLAPSKVLQDFNFQAYDSFFKFRPVEAQIFGPVVIVAADNPSTVRLAREGLHDWPWPRDKWAEVIHYAEHCGAKAVVFDILFNLQSRFADNLDDDVTLGQAAYAAKLPVVFAVECKKEGDPVAFAPFDPDHKNWKPNQGNAIVDQNVLRWYEPTNRGLPSVASVTLNLVSSGRDVFGERNFSLHYYGRDAFRYVSAADVFDAVKTGGAAGDALAPPEWFRDKIVLVGATATGTFDSKASPFAEVFPGVEYQATAIVNMLEHRKVHEVPAALDGLAVLAVAILAAIAGTLPRGAWFKLGYSACAIVLPLGVSFSLFRGHTIYWLPPAGPVLAALVTVGFALLWSYLVEDRSRKFFTKALTQYVSVAVVDELARHPEKLRISSERREMTVMFTDIAGFTDLSEKLEAESLAKLLNFYLNEMSSIVLSQDGTVDKYVGDAIVSFWNAPLPQPDHAIRACRAALAMHRREGEIAEELARLGGPGLHTRLGINTGVMAVGNMGCDQKFNYSVLGDPVNLASRLEGQNKYYGTPILISQTTADAVGGRFLLRKIDAIKVKGKLKPVTVYELMSEAPGDAGRIALAADFEKALEAYQRQDWDEAEKRIVAIQAVMPDDGPCKTLAKRIASYRHDPPPADWDGVYVSKEK